MRVWRRAFYLGAQHIEAIDDLSRRLGVSRSTVVRRAILELAALEAPEWTPTGARPDPRQLSIPGADKKK